VAGSERDGAPPPSPPERWLAQGGAVSSGRLASRIAGDAAARELSRPAPDLAVLLATPERAAELQAEFADELVLERDAPLTPPG
jgi:hypothetical protein